MNLPAKAPTINTSLQFKSNVDFSRINQLLNNNVVPLYLRNISSKLTATTKLRPNIIIDYGYSSELSYLGFDSKPAKLAFTKNKLMLTSTIFLFKDKIGLKLKQEYFNATGLTSRGTFFFSDLSISYFRKKNRIELFIDNITNQREYFHFNTFGNTQIWNIFQLRPRQFLLKHSFTF